MGDDSSSSESFDSDISISEDPTPGSPSTSVTTTSPIALSSLSIGGDDFFSDSHTKQGYIEIRGANKKNKIISKWRLSWCLLDGGSLFIYKNYEVCLQYYHIEI